MRWWIPRIRLEEEASVVRNALALLVEQGMVERLVLPSGRVMFRRLRRDDGCPGATDASLPVEGRPFGRTCMNADDSTAGGRRQTEGESTCH